MAFLQWPSTSVHHIIDTVNTFGTAKFTATAIIWLQWYVVVADQLPWHQNRCCSFRGQVQSHHCYPVPSVAYSWHTDTNSGSGSNEQMQMHILGWHMHWAGQWQNIIGLVCFEWKEIRHFVWCCECFVSGLEACQNNSRIMPVFLQGP